MDDSEITPNAEAAVVGGGLAGLVAAAHLARSGTRVWLLESSASIGGRGRTIDKNGYLMNLGAHALYRRGAGARFLRELDVPISGRVPSVESVVLIGNKTMQMPMGLGSLLQTRALTFRGKMQLARFMSRITKLDASQFDSVSVREWIDRTVSASCARLFLHALVRLTTYVNSPDVQSAGAAITQLQLAFRGGVLYLDGGWQSLVDGLYDQITRAGGIIRPSSPVAELCVTDGTVSGVVLTNGERVATGNVLLALPPSATQKLLPDGFAELLVECIAKLTPIRAASLTVGLTGYASNRPPFALGLDQPLYYSVHSDSAALAPERSALIHVMKYHGADVASPEKVKAELNGVLDRMQPGWKSHCVAEHFLPNITVAGGLDEASSGGLQARPPVHVSDLSGLYVAGDWIGSEGTLADASIASGYKAAETIQARLKKHNERLTNTTHC